MSHDCVLCGLVSGELERSVPYEEERALVFMDIRPVVRGHMLVVPRDHAPYLADLAEEDALRIFEVARRAAAALRASKLRCDGVNLFLADGEAAGQEVYHVHLHVIPRYPGDGFGLRFPPDYAVRERAELEGACHEIAEAWA
jgi:diadenosine tetraphosphate (Ap4A) HIT family hydrolase